MLPPASLPNAALEAATAFPLAAQDHAYVKPVQEPKKEMGYMGRFWNRLPWNDSKFIKHMAEQFLYGQEDNVCDYIPNTNPKFEEELALAKIRDNANRFPFPFIKGAITKELHKQKLDKEFNGVRQPDDNCEGLRSWP